VVEKENEKNKKIKIKKEDIYKIHAREDSRDKKDA
jgi:hypothetical protein